MTREEAIEWLGRIKDRYIHGGDEGFDNKRKEAIDMAIEALSDRPKVNAELKADWLRRQYEIVIEENKRLKADGQTKGKWNNIPFGNLRACSNCGYICTPILAYQTQDVYNYCPNCGAKMEGQEE